MATIGDYFAPPPPPATLPPHIEKRNFARCRDCTRLLEHLHQPDGTLRLSDINIGKIARATKIKVKHVARALKDLVKTGVVAAYEAHVHIVKTAKGITTGNRCGHHPERPRWFHPPEWHKPHSHVLVESIKAIRDYYYSPKAVLPSLNEANRKSKKSTRQQKSERREACIALMGAILQYTDLVTLRVGIPQWDGSFIGLTMVELAGLAGLADIRPDGKICIRRAERAAKDLKAAGIITVKRQYEEPEKGVYRGLAAIRTVSKHFFEAIGKGKWLEHERERAVERAEKKARKRQRKALGNVRLAVNAIDNNRPPEQKQEAESAPARTGEMKSAADIAFETMRRNLGVAKPPP